MLSVCQKNTSRMAVYQEGKWLVTDKRKNAK
ncbi:DNA topoisomerase I subunit omega [Vibrio cholerae]|nr:DNA topoisomerase I subunit omega [Vibrio cholerae]